MKDLRKTVAPNVVTELQDAFCKLEFNRKHNRNPSTFKYMQNCIAVCWFMAVQDPAVYIDTTSKIPTTFDENYYKAYTRAGKKIQFIVWPVLYLHKDGPLMGKGVAQGSK